MGAGFGNCVGERRREKESMIDRVICVPDRWRKMKFLSIALQL